MPLPLIASLILAGLPAAQQVVSGVGQAGKARKVKLQDTRPASFLEELAMRRQAANNQRMPGQGAAEERINQGQATAYNNMLQAGTSGANVLSGLSQLNRNTNVARQGLATQAAQFQMGNQDKLVSTLRQDAAYRTGDLATFNKTKGALKEASNRNIYGGLANLGSIGMYAATGGFNNLGKDRPTEPIGSPNNLLENQSQTYNQSQRDWRPPGVLPLLEEDNDFGASQYGVDGLPMGSGYRREGGYRNRNDIYNVNPLNGPRRW